MKRYELEISQGALVDISPSDEKRELFIPKEVNTIMSEPILLLHPAAITVEEGHDGWRSSGNCLMADNALLIGCENSVIPPETEKISDHAFDMVCDLPKELSLPQGLKYIGRRAFSTDLDHEITITVPKSVRHIDCMAFMIRAPHKTVVFEGDCALSPGVFGTQAESKDTVKREEVYGDMPAFLYIDPKTVTVIAADNTLVANYCEKYGITRKKP